LFKKNLIEYVDLTNKDIQQEIEKFALKLKGELENEKLNTLKDLSKKQKEKELLEEGERINASYLRKL